MITKNLHPATQEFIKIIDEMRELHLRKQKDYGKPTDPFANVRGSEEWNVAPWVGAMIRANDKVRRAQAYVRNGSVANEGLEDALIDLAVYAVIALVLFREENQCSQS